DVLLVGRALARVARGTNARRAEERVDDESRVVGQGGGAARAGGGERLLARVLLEGLAVLVDGRERGGDLDLDAIGGEDRGDLARLVAVRRREHDAPGPRGG